MIAIFEHELTVAIHSIKTWVFAAFMLCFTGVGAMVYNLNSSIANFEYVLGYISIILVVMVPLLTMHVMSEERHQRTDQMLYSLPISTTEVIFGKFLALAVIFAVPVACICAYPLIFSRFGSVYLPTSYGSLVAFFFLGLALLSIGLFVSCLTESQGMAAGLCAVAMLFLYYCDTLSNFVSGSVVGSLVGLGVLILLLALIVRGLTKSGFFAFLVFAACAVLVCLTWIISPDSLNGLLPAIVNGISPFTRFKTFINGVFDISVLVYDISIIAFFLFLSIQSLEKRRYNG